MMPDCSPADAADDAPRQVANTAIKRRFIGCSFINASLPGGTNLQLGELFHALWGRARGTQGCASGAPIPIGAPSNPRVFWTFPGYGVRLPPAQSGNVVSLLRRFQGRARRRSEPRRVPNNGLCRCRSPVFPCMSATPGDSAMYASKIAKPQTKTAAGSTDRLRSQHPGLARPPFGSSAVELASFLQGTIVRRAALSDTATFESVCGVCNRGSNAHSGRARHPAGVVAATCVVRRSA